MPSLIPGYGPQMYGIGVGQASRGIGALSDVVNQNTALNAQTLENEKQRKFQDEQRKKQEAFQKRMFWRSKAIDVGAAAGTGLVGGAVAGAMAPAGEAAKGTADLARTGTDVAASTATPASSSPMSLNAPIMSSPPIFDPSSVPTGATSGPMSLAPSQAPAGPQPFTPTTQAQWDAANPRGGDPTGSLGLHAERVKRGYVQSPMRQDQTIQPSPYAGEQSTANLPTRGQNVARGAMIGLIGGLPGGQIPAGLMAETSRAFNPTGFARQDLLAAQTAQTLARTPYELALLGQQAAAAGSAGGASDARRLRALNEIEIANALRDPRVAKTNAEAAAAQNMAGRRAAETATIEARRPGQVVGDWTGAAQHGAGAYKSMVDAAAAQARGGLSLAQTDTEIALRAPRLAKTKAEADAAQNMAGRRAAETATIEARRPGQVVGDWTGAAKQGAGAYKSMVDAGYTSQKADREQQLFPATLKKAGYDTERAGHEAARAGSLAQVAANQPLPTQPADFVFTLKHPQSPFVTEVVDSTTGRPSLQVNQAGREAVGRVLFENPSMRKEPAIWAELARLGYTQQDYMQWEIDWYDKIKPMYIGPTQTQINRGYQGEGVFGNPN